jgi:hypothetical protein
MRIVLGCFLIVLFIVLMLPMLLRFFLDDGDSPDYWTDSRF